MDTNIISLIFNIITTMVVVYLTLLALKHTAKPKIKIIWTNKNLCFTTSTCYQLLFNLLNTGHWYGRPAAKNIVFYFAFLPPIELNKIKFGSSLEKENTKVLKGKGDSIYLKVEGVHLMYSEPSEKIELSLTTPETPGKHNFWITACSEDGVFDIFRYQFNVSNKKD
jgi:hypothetical protein